MSSLIETIDLNKIYYMGKKQERSVLENINFNIVEGQFVALMGPSGSGKSTLLYALSGMDKATSGSIFFKQQELTMLSESMLADIRLKYMGFIFQHAYFLNNLTLFDNILLPAFFSKKFSYRDSIERANRLMKKMGITELTNHGIGQVSGGQLQRASICRALINQPHILFGDEPTGALNSRMSNEVIDLLININLLGTTILIATHDIKVAAKSERVIYLMDGKIIDEKKLGKYSAHDTSIKQRENSLTTWLSSLGY